MRLAIVAEGIVQGVGMRPFVYRAALEHELVGWVRNDADGIRIEAQGALEHLRAFVETLERDGPRAGRLTRVRVSEIPSSPSDTDFRIIASALDAAPRAVLPPDLAMCAACALEVSTPGARRYRYPFTHCTDCGPRATIVTALPYDRARTTMKSFVMCEACRAEYEDPSDRRFHAEAIACPACGPTLALECRDVAARGERALDEAISCLRRGEVLAVQGLGGFQLLVDATREDAVRELRRRKGREAKPLAVLFSSPDDVRRHCSLSSLEERELASPTAPIALLTRRVDGLAPSVAPRQPRIGAMLPTTPLHKLLVEGVGRPLVCTSGNLSEEPMCIDIAAAAARLADVADAFLHHDREIVRPVDDSVVRVDPGGITVLRRARGLSPAALTLAEATPTVLALGAQQKSTVALAIHGEVIVSPHVGDLHSVDGARLHEATARDMLRFFDAEPDAIACDLHPDYASTRLAERLAAELDVPLVRVQHHHAHVMACAAEHGLTGRVLGLAWDGAGLGDDGALWGGEALVCEGDTCRRVAHLRPFALPGGEAAMREPRRAALGLLHAVFGAEAIDHAEGMFSSSESRTLVTMLERRVSTPVTTSVGRLFDAVAALVGVAPAGRLRFEGEAAMALEDAAVADEVAPYPMPLSDGTPAVADWGPLVRALLADVRSGAATSLVAARFHATLAALAETVAARCGVRSVVLAGGCFQNALLTRLAKGRLTASGHRVYTARELSPNDGALSVGQALVASRFLARGGGAHVPGDPR